jgi:hypothetical protein
VPATIDDQSMVAMFGRSPSHFHTVDRSSLPEPCRAAAHDLALANELGVELGTVKREVDVEVYAVEGALGSVHALKVLLEVLAAEIGSEGDNFLDACEWVSDVVSLLAGCRCNDLRGSLVYSGHTSSSQA